MNLRSLQAILKYLVALLMLLALADHVRAQQPQTPGLILGGGRTIPRARADTGPKPKTIEGTVEDANGNPIENAHVMVRDTKSNVTRTLTTNAKGVYSGTAFPPTADYEVVAEFRGENSDKKLVSGFLDREDNVLNFKMKAVLGPVTNAPRPAAAAPAGPQLDTFDLVKLQVTMDLPTGVPAPIPAVMLIHGFGEDRTAWNDFKKLALARGFAVMTLDLRGHGNSKIKNNVAITANAAWRNSPHEFPLDLDAAMTWLKTQPRINSNKIAVIGSDVGANLALIASGRFPQVRTVVAVNPNLHEGQEMAGGALDFKPRSALIFAASEAEANTVKAEVQAPVETRVLLRSVSATAAWSQNTAYTDAIFQWLKTTL